jgi:hypothetical protein
MSYVTQAASIGDTSLYLDNVGDFAEGAGVAYIAAEAVGKTIRVAYTGRDFTQKKLTGCTITEAIPAGRQAWYQSFQTLPLTYTVFDNKIWFDKVIPDVLKGRVIYVDYYTTIVRLKDLTDEVPEKWRTAYKHFLRFANKRRLDDSIGKDDADYQRFDKALRTIIGNNNNGQSIRIRN